MGYTCASQLPPASVSPHLFIQKVILYTGWKASYFTLLLDSKKMTLDKDLYLISVAIVVKILCVQAISGCPDTIKIPNSQLLSNRTGVRPRNLHSRWFWIGCLLTEPKLLCLGSEVPLEAGCHPPCVISQHSLYQAPFWNQADAFGISCGSPALSCPRA